MIFHASDNSTQVSRCSSLTSHWESTFSRLFINFSLAIFVNHSNARCWLFFNFDNLILYESMKTLTATMTSRLRVYSFLLTSHDVNYSTVSAFELNLSTLSSKICNDVDFVLALEKVVKFKDVSILTAINKQSSMQATLNRESSI